MGNKYYIDSISHHGVLGQKWGVKNGPPYPLVEKRFVLPQPFKDLKMLSQKI